MAFIDIQHVYKHYASHTALEDVSLSINQGRVFGLLGPNGAGKTSLIRIINRITAPDSGQVLFDGHPLSLKDVERIGYLPEERGLYRKMKVGQHALYLAELHGLKHHEAKRRLEEWFDKLDIMPWWDKRVEELSKGMQQKVQFVCTVLHDPDLLIFDEPFSGFDPINAELLKSEMMELARRGKTIIFSTHNMQSVEEVCDDIALINRSRLILSGEVGEVRQRYASSVARLTLASPLEEAECHRLGVLDSVATPAGYRYRIEQVASRSNRELIGLLPSSAELLHFEMETPSMHEIFIQAVQNHG